MRWEYSCGAVVFTVVNGVRQYVLVQQTGGHYGFPKGHMEAGETEVQTALREIREEVGLSPRLLEGFRTEMVYPLSNGKTGMKHITLFLGEYSGQTIVTQASELRCAVLADLDQAVQLLSHADFRRVLREAEDFLNARG